MPQHVLCWCGQRHYAYLIAYRVESSKLFDWLYSLRIFELSSTSLGSSSMSLRSLSSVLLCSVNFKMICREIHHHPIKLFGGLEHGQEHDSGWNLYDPEQEVLWTPGWGSKRIVNGGLFRIGIPKSSGFPNLGQHCVHVCTNRFANSPTLPRYSHVSQHTSPGFKPC